MLSRCSAQDPVKDRLPFWSTELEGETQGQDKLLPQHLGHDQMVLGPFTPTWQRAAYSRCTWCSWSS